MSPIWRRGAKASLFAVCGMVKQFPEETLPEIAIVGKSNVGKSSLINSLIGRKGTGRNGLARTSSVPGKTRTINWYSIDECLYFVDLPGYGYAKISKTEQQKWGKVIETYLSGRNALKAALLLVDIRHEPGANDVMMMDYFRAFGIPTIVIATKADKVTRNQLPHQKKILADKLGIKSTEILPYSATAGTGKDEIWTAIENAAGIEKD
ncbi:MAG: YihA family ribosome biogenesis GTP-binding protein [Firmicutes bacterium]|nr:YihA family ribosome biogenesis GTP-binding protein [Bacillota bacterium]